MNGKMRRVPTYYQDLIDIIAANPGHIIGSTACLGSFISQKILQWYNEEQPQDLYQQMQKWLKNIEDIFGKGNFFLETQPSTNKEQRIVNRTLLILSKELNIPIIITTDSHYTRKEDASIHKAFLNAQEGEREVDSFYATTYLMGTEELESLMIDFTEEDLQQSYKNILTIKNQCQDYSIKKPLRIPSLIWKEAKVKEINNIWYERIPYLKIFASSSFDGDIRLAKIIVDKLEETPKLQEKKIYDEINDNLRITWQSSEINKAHWSAYFLNLQKVIEVCWDAGTLVGPGRGSGVGFLLLYILDIIQINCLWETTQTYSWRFLNPERVSVLDVDVDIEGARRAQTLQGLRNYYGQDRIANVVTFKTEKSKSAIQTAARGLGIDVDTALYLSSLIPADRGQTRTLSQCYYGDEENDFKSIPLFVREMNNYPELWKVSQKIEGLICGVGEHAGGVILVDEPFTKSTALMKVPNGDIVTQFDLHDCEKCSLIKLDLLSVEALDKIHTCLDLLCEDNYIERESTLKKTYEKVIGIYNLEREDKKMWQMVWKHQVQSLFQMEQQSGIQGIALTKPESVDDLAVLNSVIRLMAQEKNAEQPLNKYARFKKDINLWYQEMRKYGLTSQEQKILEPIVKQSYGICESQEKFMKLVQMPECGGFDLTWADSLRKSIAKKNPKAFLKLQDEYFQKTKEKGLSKNLCNYVWNVLVSTSKGYGFNASHTLAYSLVGLQEMNLAYKYPLIFWNTACLITNSGSLEDASEEELVDIYAPEGQELSEGIKFIDLPDKSAKIRKTASTDYAKLAKAIGDTRAAGINVSLANINESSFGFKPDVKNNRILYGLKGMLNIGDDLINEIIAGRPYVNPKDFYYRINPKKQSMVSLIKGGAFDDMCDRKFLMAWYIWETCDKKSRLTLQNLPSIIKYGLLPESTPQQIMARRVYEFNRYLKAISKGKCREDCYLVDERATNFLIELNLEHLIKEMGTIILVKDWNKVYQNHMDVFRHWLGENKDQILNELNFKIFQEDWVKYAGEKGKDNYSAWEMETLCFYYHEHEMKNVNFAKYGCMDFFKMPEEPRVERTFPSKDGKEIRIYELKRICGTCIAKNKNKSTVTLLTTSGVVNVRFRKEYFALFDKQISARGADGVKHRIESSWFNRGSMIMVTGIRQGDDFVAKRYASTAGHTLYKISEILSNGDLLLQTERAKGELEDEE